MVNIPARLVRIVTSLIKTCFTGWLKVNFNHGIIGKIEKGPNYID
ncbi:unnamed protein product [marine sediment metagenome]|uniref:Uncharacterized protein n=1 Tax=marine sediment metagenome TaxID=412755 RepID=X0YF00_9ZZZZ